MLTLQELPTKQASVPDGFRPSEINTSTDHTYGQVFEALQIRRTLIERERERRELTADAQRHEIEIDEYKNRLENENLTDINRRKIESHIERLKDRSAFCDAMIEQLDIEMVIFNDFLKRL